MYKYIRRLEDSRILYRNIIRILLLIYNLKHIGLHLRNKFEVKLEPGLFEWMAWYPEGVPDWMSKSELLEADYNIDTSYQPFISVNKLNECVKETTEEFYTRNFETIRNIIETASELVIFFDITLIRFI